MIQLVDEFFGTRRDPRQISVNEETMATLKQIHPSTMSEKANKNGPIAWVMVIPTTREVMNRFIKKNITEGELLAETVPGQQYEALYLCSALVLPEYRGKGYAKRLVGKAIRSIRKNHPIKYLYVWAFSNEGKRLASYVAKEFGLPLKRRVDKR